MEPEFTVVKKIKFKGNGKGKIQPITCLEDPEGK
jgi:hypothetical protein